MIQPLPCLREDDFTRELWVSSPRWTATLSDGTTAIQDDGRPGCVLSAWLRLAGHVKRSGLRVTGLKVQFRNEDPVVMPNDADGYFFRHGVGALLNTGQSWGFVLVGYLKAGQVVVRRYEAPQLTFVEEELRDPEDGNKVGISLIRNG